MAYGMRKVDKRGNWIFETGVRDADLTKLDDRRYMHVDAPRELGGQIQQVFTLEFPEEAVDSEVDSDSLEKTILQFDMETPAS